MSDQSRRERGIEMFNKVYCGDIPVAPEGMVPFQDLMIEQLFGEIWSREALSVRDRRLVIMGIIAAMGEADTFCIQTRSAVKNGELTPEQVREIVIQVAQYAGYPRAAAIFRKVEETLAQLAKP